MSIDLDFLATMSKDLVQKFMQKEFEKYQSNPSASMFSGIENSITTSAGELTVVASCKLLGTPIVDFSEEYSRTFTVSTPVGIELTLNDKKIDQQIGVGIDIEMEIDAGADDKGQTVFTAFIVDFKYLNTPQGNIVIGQAMDALKPRLKEQMQASFATCFSQFNSLAQLPGVSDKTINGLDFKRKRLVGVRDSMLFVGISRRYMDRFEKPTLEVDRIPDYMSGICIWVNKSLFEDVLTEAFWDKIDHDVDVDGGDVTLDDFNVLFANNGELVISVESSGKTDSHSGAWWHIDISDVTITLPFNTDQKDGTTSINVTVGDVSTPDVSTRAGNVAAHMQGFFTGGIVDACVDEKAGKKKGSVASDIEDKIDLDGIYKLPSFSGVSYDFKLAYLSLDLNSPATSPDFSRGPFGHQGDGVVLVSASV